MTCRLLVRVNGYSLAEMSERAWALARSFYGDEPFEADEVMVTPSPLGELPTHEPFRGEWYFISGDHEVGFD